MNDSFATAQVVPNGTYSGVLTGTTVGAGTENIFSEGGTYPDYEVWYTWEDLPAGTLYFDVHPKNDCFAEAAVWSTAPGGVTAPAPGAYGPTYQFGYGSPGYLIELNITHPGGPLTLGVAFFDFDTRSRDFWFFWRHNELEEQNPGGTVQFEDTFDDTLVPGGTKWEVVSPGAPTASMFWPYNQGGSLHLPYVSYFQEPDVGSYKRYREKCATVTWEIADLPLATIYSVSDLFSLTLRFQGQTPTGQTNSFGWQFDWFPPGMPGPETATAYPNLMFYPEIRTGFPPQGLDTRGEIIEWDPAAHRWLRIREECHQVYWETSSNGEVWNLSPFSPFGPPARPSFTGVLHPDYAYNQNFEVVMGMRSGYTTHASPAFTVQIGSVSVVTKTECVCPDLHGWHVGRFASGGAW